MNRIFLIGLAGAAGTLARYFTGLWAGRVLGSAFPHGTLIVNLVGSFLIVAITHVALVTTLVSPTLRLTLTTGFVGGLTTYSSFDLETTDLLRDRAWLGAAANVAVTLGGCFLAGLLGLVLARRLVGE